MIRKVPMAQKLVLAMAMSSLTTTAQTGTAHAEITQSMLAPDLAAQPPKSQPPKSETAPLPVVLTLRGDFDHDGDEDIASYTMSDLRALGEDHITTSTIWTNGPQEFTGTSLHKLLAQLAITHGELIVTAINDYSVSIPVDEITPNGPILAYSRNGIDMGLRDKGPLWMVYPYDSSDIFRNEVVFSRSVWQLEQIRFTDTPEAP